MLHSGIDKHKDNCFISTVNDQGIIVGEARVKNTVADISAYFQSFGTETIGRWWNPPRDGIGWTIS